MNEMSRNIRVGIFVLAGTALLVLVLYLIGSKRNLFSSTITISTTFSNAEGLMKGNAVRYAGINIGTVKNVEIVNDSTIEILMVIQESAIENMKKNAIASIGTDGLMGNKLVNINSSKEVSESIEDGDVLKSHETVSATSMLETLSVTNENMKGITEDLKEITQKLNQNNSLWQFLSDTSIVQDLKQAVVSIRITGDKSAYIVGDLSKLVAGVKQGKGTLGALLVDTSLSAKLHQSVVNIKVISNELAEVSGDLSHVTKNVKAGKGTIGTLLMDTGFVYNMNKTIEQLNTGTKGFSDNMEALKHSIFLRKYFRKQEKKKANAVK